MKAADWLKQWRTPERRMWSSLSSAIVVGDAVQGTNTCAEGTDASSLDLPGGGGGSWR